MATISIADNDARVQYTQAVTADTTQLTIDFPFFEIGNINVIATTNAGVDTALTRGTGTGTFAVVGTAVDDGFSGGYVTLGDDYANTFTFTIFRDIEVSRTTDFPTSGPFNVSSLNTELDRITAIEQELETKISRTMGLADSDASANLKLPNLNTRKGTVLAFNATSGLPEAGPSIGSVATVSAQSANINTVAGISANVTTVAGIQANVTTVAGIDSSVTTVAGISANVTTVAGINTDVTTVAGKATEIGLLGTSDAVSDMNTLATADIVSDMNTLATASNVTNMNTLAGISGDITTVSGIQANVTTVASDGTDIGTVATSIANVNTVAGINANVTTVAGIQANVTTVAGIQANVTTVAGIHGNVTSVAGNATNINTVAGQATNLQNVTNNLTAIQNAGQNATDASNSQIAAAASASAAALALDSFDDRYLGVKSSDPTVDNDSNALVEGALYFSSTANEMRVYDGSNWIAASSAGGASLLEYKYTATANQTTFTGSDVASNTLSYTVANLIVILNGIILENGPDYTATNGSSVVLASGAALNDELNIIAFKSFTTADMVSKTNGGAFSGNVDFGSGIDVTGNITVTGTVDGRDVATDGTKLDAIEASADVTDTANVTSAGALMTGGGTLTGALNFGTSKWSIELDSGDNDLNFKYNGTTVFKLASSGAVTSASDVTAFGSP